MYGGIDNRSVTSRHGALLPKDNFMGDHDTALQRRRFNNVAIVQAILIPWLFFVAVLWLLSSEVRYYYPSQSYFLIGCGLLIIVALLAKGAIARRKMILEAQDQYMMGVSHEPTWLFFLAISCLIAWAVAIVLGNYTFATTTSKYHGINDMQVINDVNPTLLGKAYMDASILNFKNGSFIEQKYSIGFKDSDVYCVAPLGFGDYPLATYSFWAVGVNCCDPFGGKFWCSPQAAMATDGFIGIRLLNDAQRPLYRLAIKQAVAEYRLQEPANPIFVTAKMDASGNDSLQLAAKLSFGFAATVYLICQSFAVLWVVSYYQKYLM